MLSTFEVALNAFVLLLIVPVAMSLAKGSPPPPFRSIGKYYRAVPRLMRAGDLFLLTLIATSALKLVEHYALVSATDLPPLQTALSVVFFAALLAYLALWVKALLTVRRSERNGGEDVA